MGRREGREGGSEERAMGREGGESGEKEREGGREGMSK